MNKKQLLKLFEYVYTRQVTPEEAVEEYYRIKNKNLKKGKNETTKC